MSTENKRGTEILMGTGKQWVKAGYHSPCYSKGSGTTILTVFFSILV